LPISLPFKTLIDLQISFFTVAKSSEFYLLISANSRTETLPSQLA